MKDKFSVCIVGGGSRYTPDLLKELVAVKKEFPLYRVSLYDNDKERQDKVGEYGKLLFEKYYPECEFLYTLDAKEAFEDIDFAFMQIRAGGLKMREQDEKIALKHGCIGQETCGPGGFAYGLRSIPAVCDIIKDIRKYSKEAWVLNYSNPAAIVAEATKRVFPNDFRIINICDQPIGQVMFYEMLLGVPAGTIEATYFGLNHFGWFTHLYDKTTGKDYLPEVREILKKGIEFDPESIGLDQSHMNDLLFMSNIVRDYDEYLPNSYLQYYLYPNRIVKGMNPNYTRANEVMDGNEKEVFAMLEEVKKTGKLDFDGSKELLDIHGSYITDLAKAIAYNTHETFIFMTENHGIIPNLTEGMMVEVLSRVGSSGIEPFNYGEITTFYKGILENQFAYEKLAVDACLEGSYQKALMALVLNRCVNDTDKAKELLDDYIKANKGYWPELH